MNSIVGKAFGDVLAGVDDGGPHGSFDLILSTPAKDREGEEVLTAEWKQPFPRKITMDVDHKMSVAGVVGSGRPFLNSAGQLQVTGTFASTALAQETRALVREGHITRTSVTFLRRMVEGAKGTMQVSRELLNGAFVAVPCNDEAVILDAKTHNYASGYVDTRRLLAETLAACGLPHPGFDARAELADAVRLLAELDIADCKSLMYADRPARRQFEALLAELRRT